MNFVEKKRWLFLGLPWTFTTYMVSDEYITIKSGLFNQKEDDSYMYKVVDVRLNTSMVERIFGLGTVHCFGGDITDPTLVLSHIKNAKKIKNFILEASEQQRIRKRTLNTQDVAGGYDGFHSNLDME